MAKVSVMVPSYNHGEYIGKAIDSILNQTFQDFEVIISDDCSTDATVSVIQSYEDPRIKVHIFRENVGAVRNHEYCKEQCCAPYIALLNSDDVWKNEHLEEAVAYLDAHSECGAVFSWCSIIDENGTIQEPCAQIFKQPNRTRAQWLYHFFTRGNCICHPTMVIRREAYEKIGFYSRTLRQLPDFDEWIRLVKYYDIHIIPKVLAEHRRCYRKMSNTSAPTITNSIRDIAESQQILKNFFNDIDDLLFIEAFGSLFRYKGALSTEELLCEKYFLLRDDRYYMKGVSIPLAFGYFHDICQNPKVLEVFEQRYGYTLNDFYEFGGRVDILNLLANHQGKEQNITSAMHEDQNSRKNRMKALAWAVFGKDTPMYNRLQRLYGGRSLP